jgi:hypothetical protein
MKSTKNKSILLSTPTYRGKDYCFPDYLEGVMNLEVPAGYDVDFLIVENDIDRNNIEYYLKLADRLEGTGITLSRCMAGGNEFRGHVRLTLLYNYIRGYLLYFGYDYLFNVESDMILQPDTLVKLVDTFEKANSLKSRLKRFGRKCGAVTAVTSYPPDKNVPTAGGNTMVGNSFKEGEHRIFHDRQFMSMLCNGKVGWITVDVPMTRATGFAPQWTCFNPADIGKLIRQKKFPVITTAGLGCIFIDSRVFKNLFFRINSIYDWSCDLYFVPDIKKRGYDTILDPRVWPKHNWSDIGGDPAKASWQ